MGIKVSPIVRDFVGHSDKDAKSINSYDQPAEAALFPTSCAARL